MHTFTYAGPDGLELDGHWSAEWLVLEDRGGPLHTPPDVGEEDGPLLRVELRPAGREPWWLGVPLGEHELATVPHGLFALPGTERLLVALGQRAWIVQPGVRGSVEVAEVVGRAVTSVVEHELVLAVGGPHALAGFGPEGLDWCVAPEGIEQLSLVDVRDDVLHGIGVLGGEEAVALEIDPWGGDLLDEPEPIARATSLQRLDPRRFLLHDGERRRGEARFDARRGRWRAPSVYGV